MTTALERRIAAVEAELAPKPDAYGEFIAANPWLEWTTCDELEELEAICRRDEDGEGTAADGARAQAIMFSSQARMLAGEPKDIDRPREPYDIKAEYERSKR